MKNLQQASGVGVGVSYRTEPTITGDETISLLWETNEDAFVYTSYLTGIEPTNYDEDYWIVTYALDKDGYAYYGGKAEVCVFKVAKAIDDAVKAGETVPEIDINARNAFVDAAPEEYEAWCNMQVGSDPENIEITND